jgi:hypothetical protein
MAGVGVSPNSDRPRSLEVARAEKATEEQTIAELVDSINKRIRLSDSQVEGSPSTPLKRVANLVHLSYLATAIQIV